VSALILSLVGAGISAFGALLVAWPIAKLSKEQIDDIAATRYGFSQPLTTALLEQRFYGSCGIVAIVFGTSIQLVAGV